MSNLGVNLWWPWFQCISRCSPRQSAGQKSRSEPSSEGWPSRIIQRLWSQCYSVDGFFFCVLVGLVGLVGFGGYVNIRNRYLYDLHTCTILHIYILQNRYLMSLWIYIYWMFAIHTHFILFYFGGVLSCLGHRHVNFAMMPRKHEKLPNYFWIHPWTLTWNLKKTTQIEMRENHLNQTSMTVGATC